MVAVSFSVEAIAGVTRADNSSEVVGALLLTGGCSTHIHAYGERWGGLLSEKRDTTVITREQDSQPPSFIKFYIHRWEKSSWTGRQLEDILDMAQWKKQRCTVLHCKTLADCCAQCHGRLGQLKEELFLVSLL